MDIRVYRGKAGKQLFLKLEEMGVDRCDLDVVDEAGKWVKTLLVITQRGIYLQNNAQQGLVATVSDGCVALLGKL